MAALLLDLHTQGGGADGEHLSLFKLRVDTAFQGPVWSDRTATTCCSKTSAQVILRHRPSKPTSWRSPGPTTLWGPTASSPPTASRAARSRAFWAVHCWGSSCRPRTTRPVRPGLADGFAMARIDERRLGGMMRPDLRLLLVLAVATCVTGTADSPEAPFDEAVQASGV